MRRHPNSEDSHRKACDPNLEVVLDPVTEFVGCHCFTTWCKLSKWEQRAFVRTIWKQLPPRHGFLAPPVTVMNDHRPFRKREQFLRKHQKFLQHNSVDVTSLLAAQAKRLTHHLKTSVVEYHRAGQILIAIDPAAPIPRITKGVESAVNHWREGQKAIATGKAHIGQWLDAIAKFETAEFALQKNQIRNDQLFANYRRRIKDWIWRS